MIIVFCFKNWTQNLTDLLGYSFDSLNESKYVTNTTNSDYRKYDRKAKETKNIRQSIILKNLNNHMSELDQHYWNVDESSAKTWTKSSFRALLEGLI